MSRLVNANGNDVRIGDGETYSVDNVTREFTVRIRSMRPVSENEIKNLIETRYEVTSIVANEENDVAVVVGHG